MNVAEWLDGSSDHVCDDCGHETFISTLGSSGLKLRCEGYDCECYPMCTLLEMLFEEDPVAYKLPSGDVVEYQCPECDSKDIDRTPHGDGCGYVDVKIECEDCAAYMWE